jgi:hypothetical protein
MSHVSAHDLASQMSAIVTDLFSTASASQLSALNSFGDDNERLRWFYTPTDHGGLALADMSTAQHRIVHRLLATSLSVAGHTTASTIMGLENVLDRVEGFSVSYGRERGRDPLLYWLSVFGDPDSPSWSWRFGGHHISLHFTIRDESVISATPLFLGADPASSQLLGPHLLRPLGGAEDLARELLHSLRDEDRARAHLSPRAPVDLLGANRTRLSEGDSVIPLNEIWRGRFEPLTDEFLAKVHQSATAKAGWNDDDDLVLGMSATPKGLAIGPCGESQTQLLRQLLGVYLDRIHPSLANEQWRRAESNLNEFHFLWAGGVEPGEPHYYRLEGGGILIEYDNSQRDVNHVHTVWRDLTMDFGGDPLAQHYRTEHN